MTGIASASVVNVHSSWTQISLLQQHDNPVHYTWHVEVVQTRHMATHKNNILFQVGRNLSHHHAKYVTSHASPGHWLCHAGTAVCIVYTPSIACLTVVWWLMQYLKCWILCFYVCLLHETSQSVTVTRYTKPLGMCHSLSQFLNVT